jgi:hypothetical protein
MTRAARASPDVTGQQFSDHAEGGTELSVSIARDLVVQLAHLLLGGARDAPAAEHVLW